LSLGDAKAIDQFYKTQGATGFADFARPGKKFVESKRAKLPSISHSRKSSKHQNRDMPIGAPRDAVQEYLLMLEQPQTARKFTKSK